MLCSINDLEGYAVCATARPRRGFLFRRPSVGRPLPRRRSWRLAFEPKGVDLAHRDRPPGSRGSEKREAEISCLSKSTPNMAPTEISRTGAVGQPGV
jgi:hypothetical protein